MKRTPFGIVLSLTLFFSWLAMLRPAKVYAHLVTTGMGPVYDGIGHLLLTPEDLIPVLAVGLYAGLRGTAAGRTALFFLPMIWLVGGLLGFTVAAAPSFPYPALSFILLGLLIAADLHLPPIGFSALAVSVGLVHGFLNGIALKNGPGSLGMLGIMASLFTLIALVAAFVHSLKPLWTRVVVRVLGGWITAMGVLMVGWHLSGRG